MLWPVIWALILPSANAHGFDLDSFLISTMIVLLIGSAAVFGIDRNKLLSSLASQVAARRVAEAANATKTQFIKMMSHELRTPLNAILGYAEILDEDLGALKAAGPRQDAQRVGAAGRRLLGLIDDILDMSKLESGDVELELVDTDIDALVQDVKVELAPLAASRDNQLSIHISSSMRSACVDPAMLRRCLLNLASNACKYTEHGCVTIYVDDRDEHLKFRIVDTGIGIDASQMDDLFEPFVQSDSSATRKFGGAGLGLALTRKLARLMGGDVSVESAPGAGSTFTLWVSSAPTFAQHEDTRSAA